MVLTGLSSRYNQLLGVLGLLALLLFCVLLAGCSGAEETPDFGDWTMNEDGLTLTDTFRVSETENFYFGSVSSLDVTSDGRMVVADGQASNIKVLQPEGGLLDTLGGSGEGPGEFQVLTSVQVARGDSIYAYDFRQSRLTVFGPGSSYEVARTVTIPRDEGRAEPVIVLDSGLAAAFGSTMIRREDINLGDLSKPPIVWRQIRESGMPGDTLMLARQSRIAASTDFVLDVVPFDRNTEVVIGPDAHLYYGWTDSLHIEAIPLEGSSKVVASVPTEPVPVTEAERDSVLSDVEKEVRSIVASAMPETKPAFTDLVIAENGRLWVKRPLEGPEAESVLWWVLDPETKTIHEIHLPREVNLEVVRNGRAYGSTTTEAGAPAVVRYRIRTQS